MSKSLSRIVIFVALLPILGFFNYAIYEKETLISQGELILLELAPADPRSLMQGDYMRLRFRAARDANNLLNGVSNDQDKPQSRSIVVALDESKKARFARFHQQNQTIGPNERLLPFRWHPSSFRPRIELHPDAYFFQEGYGPLFENAKYGMIRWRVGGDYLLVGLADEQGKQILPHVATKASQAN